MNAASETLILAFVMGISAPVSGQEIPRRPHVHDPSTLVSEEGKTHFFSTGNGVAHFLYAEDGSTIPQAPVFPVGQQPAWHHQLVPEHKGHLWAPDAIQVNGRWLVYYSVSSFGKQTSAIGLASRPELADADTPWRDDGPVITSSPGSPFNAIDPALVLDGERLWMSFGSFWDGIMLTELDPATGHLLDPEKAPLPLAMKREIEAPFIHREGDFYYLFVNWGTCCRGIRSTYEIRVGRSKEIAGPYLDREGIPMSDGGGSLVLATSGVRIGPGHASIFESADGPRLAYHYYDAQARGAARLGTLPLKWRDAWPELGALGGID